MVNCPKCGKKNSDDAVYCNKCGAELEKDVSESQMEKNIRDFGEEVQRFGKKMEKAFEETGKKAESWYDRTFGFFGPLLSGIVAFIVLLIVIRILMYFGNNYSWMQSVGNFLEAFIILFLVLILLSSYSNYFSKKYKPFRFFSPIIAAVIFAVWFWVAIRILDIISQEFDIGILGTISDLFEILLIPIALLIVVLGYVSFFVANAPREVLSASEKQKESGKAEKKERDEDVVGYKRLYRSGKDRLLGGVCGGLAEYFSLDPVLVRLVFIFGFLVTLGTMILAYLIFWIIVPRNPAHSW